MGFKPVNKSFCLEKLCETNYQKLLRLIPGLLSIKDSCMAYSAGKPALYLEITETTKYTLTLSLSHCFAKERDKFLQPAIKIRIYRDAQLAEVIRDHDQTDVAQAVHKISPIQEVIDYKWSLNYFLDKWLDHCLLVDYQFGTIHTETAREPLSMN